MVTLRPHSISDTTANHRSICLVSGSVTLLIRGFTNSHTKRGISLTIGESNRFGWSREALRAVVTGGAGFIGSAVSEALIHDGWEVTIFDNLSSGYKDHLPAFSQIPLLKEARMI